MSRAKPSDLDPERFSTRWFEGRGFRQAYVREGTGGVPVLLIHGWPETKRIWWKVIDSMAGAGFEVIAPDLRGFGESALAPDGFHDAPSSSRDLYALAHDELGHDKVVVVAGDYGGAIAQDLALRFPNFVDRLVLFNSPLPYDKERMAQLDTLAKSTHDYFIRQGTDPDGLLADLPTPEQRERYIATFYSSRLWAHPGAFADATIAFHTQPFADAAKLRASWGAYEQVFNPDTRSEPMLYTRNETTKTLIMFGTSDHVIAPDFDRMAALVFVNHVGPYLLRECGHFVQWEAAEILVNTLVGFSPDLVGA
ncbi:MAG: alpha/beta hydrolase [Actinobacteria bacterium]|nr:alpha/beta hydrolase [Actinomycetota bacterium]